MRKVAGWHEAEHILEHLPSDIEQYLLNHKVRIISIRLKWAFSIIKRRTKLIKNRAIERLEKEE